MYIQSHKFETLYPCKVPVFTTHMPLMICWNMNNHFHHPKIIIRLSRASI